jgi:predicted nucleotidyltransferase
VLVLSFGVIGLFLKKNFFLMSVRIIAMDREKIRETLQKHHTVLEQRFGVGTLSVFGSVARNEAGPGSDIDLLVEFNRPVGYFGLFELQDFLESLLGCKVDLGTRESLKPRIRDSVIGECIRVA